MGFDQETKDKGHTLIDEIIEKQKLLIEMYQAGATGACKIGNKISDAEGSDAACEFYTSRDTLYIAQADVVESMASMVRAKGRSGGVVAGDVKPKSGAK